MPRGPSFNGAHATIYVRDLGRSRRFYARALGRPPSYTFPGGVGFVIFPGFALDLTEDAARAGTPPWYLTLAVKGLDRFRAGLRRRGVPRVGPVIEDPHGRRFSVRDPDGHTLEFAE